MDDILTDLFTTLYKSCPFCVYQRMFYNYNLHPPFTITKTDLKVPD